MDRRVGEATEKQLSACEFDRKCTSTGLVKFIEGVIIGGLIGALVAEARK